ncbi:MbcA/ParS/Xre antitoxin family protein [Bradyrhizobium aeschynomenes]|uniref:MbcA/ParS/Xre antitoxin family protein n=1 Tax=Bradyrhizobium aeschynomenes TaxID=2734909 RepID=UPI00155237FA|nr:MbcA/ParS/Xre antitoxin family protein [Bradyrhizobium aeschynomenes]NPV22110.1 DUF2384 domain-containing protein [Bradyrhizobium aeschynomenes]
MTPEASTEIPLPKDGILTPDALRDSKMRERLSAPAVSLFLKLTDLWQLSVDDRRALAGDISRPTYHNWRNGKVGTLTRDQLERVSLVLGIQKGLRTLFSDDASATRWFTNPNHDLPFGGLSPLQRALRGSIDDLYAVRRYLDAWRGVK